MPVKCNVINIKIFLLKGASKTGTAPDGSSYVDAAEKEEIKALLR